MRVAIDSTGAGSSGSNASVGSTGSAAPTSATFVGGTDGTDLRGLSVNSSGVLALPQGAATAAKQPALGTAGSASTDVITVQGIASMTALKVDGSAVTQPVSGPLTDTQLRATAVPVSGTVTANLGTIGAAATAANQTTGNSSLSSIDGKVYAPFQTATGTLTTASGSCCELFVYNGNTYGIDVAGTWTGIMQVDGSMDGTTWNSLIIYDYTTLAIETNIDSTVVGNGAYAVYAGGWKKIRVSTTGLGSGTANITVVLNTGNPPLTSTASAFFATVNLRDGNGTALTSSNPLFTKESVSSSSAVTSVASSASSVSLLASNANRLGATFYNDSTQTCYLKLGATASSSSYTVQLGPNAYYELPSAHVYTGAIDGIWASANGNMRITELS